MRIPVLMVLKIKDRGRGVNLYIFLPLIFLLLLPLLLLGVFVYTFMVIFRAAPRVRKTTIGIITHLPGLLAATYGTEIIVHSDESDVKILVK